MMICKKHIDIQEQQLLNQVWIQKLDFKVYKKMILVKKIMGMILIKLLIKDVN